MFPYPCGQMSDSFANTVNQQILAAINFGVSQNKVIWRLLNLVSPRGRLCSVRSTNMLAVTNISETRNLPNSPNIIACQNLLIYNIGRICITQTCKLIYDIGHQGHRGIPYKNTPWCPLGLPWNTKGFPSDTMDFPWHTMGVTLCTMEHHGVSMAYHGT